MLEMLWVGFSSRPTVAASFGAFDGWAAPVDGFIPETSVAPDLPPSPVAPLTHRFLKEISADPGVTSLTMKFACWHKAEMLILPGKCWRWQDPCKKSESEGMYFVQKFYFSFIQHPVCSIMFLLTALYLIWGPQNRRRFNIWGVMALKNIFWPPDYQDQLSSPLSCTWGLEQHCIEILIPPTQGHQQVPANSFQMDFSPNLGSTGSKNIFWPPDCQEQLLSSLLDNIFIQNPLMHWEDIQLTELFPFCNFDFERYMWGSNSIDMKRLWGLELF